jgi:hypothetical protein
MTDTEILNALEEAMGDEIAIEFKRIWLTSRSSKWTVSYQAQFEEKGQRQLFSMGGGAGLRDAILKAIDNDVGRRVDNVTKELRQ